MSAEYVRARDPIEACEARRSLGPGARFMAGGTALQLAWPDGRLHHPVVDILGIDMGPVVSLEGGRLRIAANARLEDVRLDPLVRQHAPCISACISDIASLGVRHLATFGGNIGWRAGDLMPLLLVLGASVVLAGRDPVSLAAALDLIDEELLLAVEIPLPVPGAVACEKIGRRAAFSPSVITVAAAHGSAHSEAGLRMAVGGGPVAPALLAPSLGRLLSDDADFEAAASLIAASIAAPDDEVASGLYRAQAAGRVLADFVLANRPRVRVERGQHVSV